MGWRDAFRRRPRPADATAHERAEGVEAHAFFALGAWYVVGADGIWAVEPDHPALLAWCLRHVAGRSDDVIIIHRDAPREAVGLTVDDDAAEDDEDDDEERGW